MLEFPAGTEALLFDCDGTLVDSMPIHIEAWQATLKRYGVDLPKEFIDQRAGMPTDLIVADINTAYGTVLEPKATADEKEEVYQKRLHEVQPIGPVLETAKAYHRRLAMAVVTGGQRHIIEATLATIGATELFTVLVTADDPVAPKPSPEIYLEAARRLGIAPEKCHVFEDGEPGIVAARAAGMTWTDVRELV